MASVRTATQPMVDVPSNAAPAAVEEKFVDPNTDNLDDFADLISGKAKIKEDVEESKTDEEPETQENDEAPDEEPETDEDESEDEPSEPEPKKPEKKKNSYQDRINELTRQAREAERERDELRSKLATPETKPTTPVEVKDTTPRHDDLNEDGSDKYPLGEFDPSYIRDLTRHTIQEEQKAATQRAEQERSEREVNEARQQLHTRWESKVSDVTARYDDFVEKASGLESEFAGLDENFSDYIVQTIKSLDNGPEVLYHFANNPGEAKALVAKGPLAVTLALGALDARFAATETKPEPKVSKAPTPPPTNKGSRGAAEVRGDTDDLDAFSRMLFKRK